MKERFYSRQSRAGTGWRRAMVATLLVWWYMDAAFADGALDSFTGPLKSGLNLIMIFGFIAGCVMVMSGFLNAKRDENWKMTVIYGIGVAGALALMKALFAMFGGTASQGEVNRNDQARVQEASRQRHLQEVAMEDEELSALGGKLLGPPSGN